MDSVIIWESSIIHDCPFEFVEKLEFNHTNSLLTASSKNLLFQITEEVEFCQIKMYSTTSGLFLTAATKLPSLTNNTELKSIEQLMLADIDYKNYALDMLQTANLRKITEFLCYNTKTLMKLYLKLYDEFFLLHGMNDEEIILHSLANKLHIPYCHKITKILVHEEAFHCTKYLLVSFEYRNSTTYAYLTPENIIRQSNVRKNCSDEESIQYTLNGQYKITKGQVLVKVEKVKTSDILHPFSILDLNVSRLNYAHDSVIVKNIDLVSQINQVIQNHNYDTGNPIIPSIINSQSHFGEQLHEVYSVITSYQDYLHIIIFTILTFLILIIFSYVIFRFRIIQRIFTQCKIICTKPVSTKSELLSLTTPINQTELNETIVDIPLEMLQRFSTLKSNKNTETDFEVKVLSHGGDTCNTNPIEKPNS
jgi:hypothetical protein